MNLRLAVLIFGLCALGSAGAEAFRPTSDDQVVERLPTPGPDRRELRRLGEAVKVQPDRADLAFSLVHRYLEQGRKDADPRYFGHAEAILAPWVRSRNPDPEALILRATLRQNRHDFTAALADLDAALRQNPRLAQGWLSRAAILEVQGDYPGALRACLAAVRSSPSPAGAVCLESALSLSGHGHAVYPRLSRLVESMHTDPDELVWAQVILAELAERLGRGREAEAWYRAALQSGSRNTYLLSTYADFLLAENRPAEVVALLEDQARADPLLLRLALAERRLDRPGYAPHLAELAARFGANRARGDTTHQGDESRYALHLTGNADLALRLAQANWAVQREPRDARLLLEAAKAARQHEAARPVVEFVSRTGLEDVRLDRLLREIGGSRS